MNPTTPIEGQTPVRWYFAADVRAMRDRVYGQPISDKEWENCRDKWMDDVPWLLEQCAKLDAPLSTIHHPQSTR